MATEKDDHGVTAVAEKSHRDAATAPEMSGLDFRAACFHSSGTLVTFLMVALLLCPGRRGFEGPPGWAGQLDSEKCTRDWSEERQA